MKLITIQHVNVLKTLKKGNTYYANFERIRGRASNLIEPYKAMMVHYNYSYVPIFCGVVNRYAEFYGATTENAIIIELNVPDNLVKTQSYYDWSDVIYFTEFPNEAGSGFNLKKFTRDVLDGLNTEKDTTAIQAVIPYVKPEWVVDTHKLTNKFLGLHCGSGGRNILTENSYKEV